MRRRARPAAVYDQAAAARCAIATCCSKRPASIPTPWFNDLMIRFCAAFLDQGLAQLAAARCATRDSTSLSVRCTASGSAARTAGCGAWPGARPAARTRRSARSTRSSNRSASWASPRRNGTRFCRRRSSRSRWGGMVHQVELRGDRVVQPMPGGKPGRVPRDPADARPPRPGLHRAGRARIRRARPRILAARSRPGSIQHWPPSVEQRAFLVFQLAQVLGLSPDVLYRLSEARMVGSACRRSRRSPVSSGGGSSTWPTSDGSAPRRSTPSALHARRPAGAAGVPPVPGGLLHRRARGIVPPPPRRAGPRRRDVRRGRVLQRRHVLPGRRRRPLHAAVPRGDPARSTGWPRRSRRARLKRHRRRARTRRVLGTASHRFHTAAGRSRRRRC